MFTGRRFGGTSRMLLPPMAMSPPSGAMNPAIMRRSVVLPQPDGPRIEKKLPRSGPCVGLRRGRGGGWSVGVSSFGFCLLLCFDEGSHDRCVELLDLLQI